MTNSIIIGKALYSILSEDDKVKAMVENKIYPIVAPINTSYDYIVYSRESVTPTYCKDGNVEDNVGICIICVSNDYSKSIELANSVREALELKHGVVNEIIISSIKLKNIVENYSEDSFLQKLYFNITVN